MRGSSAGPRLLLRRLREVMAEPIGAQERLDTIVALIASNMVAEVCSIYVLRADGVLELYATEGLNPAAVHKTSLRVGEGLVGRIALEARSLNLSNAQSHPAFAYRPETGEEVYNAFLGVPILRAGRTLGVLVVQNRAHRSYTDEEVEALQTTAMVIAEMTAAGELDAIEHEGPALDLKRAMTLSGVPLAEGVGLGHVVLHEPRVVVTNLIAEDVDNELARLDEALSRVRSSLVQMLSKREIAAHGEHRDVLEAFLMVANDRGWAAKMQEAIRNGLSAEAAVERVQSDMRARMLRSTDPYLRERLHDIDDLANRLLRELMGKTPHRAADMPEHAIIVARNMGAAELLDYDRTRVRALVLEEGGPTSHVSIVARALGIPTVGQADAVVSLVEAGDAIIVDADLGEVHLRPPTDVERVFAEKVRFRARRQAQYRRLRNLPPVTRDGREIQLNMNGGLLVDLPHLEESGASGIGLFRTEILFMVAATLPRLDDQAALYARILDAAGDRPVTFRSLDIGGDKILPYQRQVEEENPAMGWRAIRLGLDRPGLLRLQIRALLKAAAGRDLRLMFPMIATVEEFERARALVERELRLRRRHGHPVPDQVKLGVMLEVPSLLFQLDELLGTVDFLSVGTNDLFQFVMAADRSNTRVASRYDPLNVAFLRVLRRIAEAAAARHVPVTICGEIASRPVEAMTLIGLGFDQLSMPPAAIGPVKAMIRSLDAGRLSARLLPRLDLAPAVDDIRDVVTRFAKTNDVSL